MNMVVVGGGWFGEMVAGRYWTSWETQNWHFLAQERRVASR